MVTIEDLGAITNLGRLSNGIRYVQDSNGDYYSVNKNGECSRKAGVPEELSMNWEDGVENFFDGMGIARVNYKSGDDDENDGKISLGVIARTVGQTIGSKLTAVAKHPIKWALGAVAGSIAFTAIAAFLGPQIMAALSLVGVVYFGVGAAVDLCKAIWGKGTDKAKIKKIENLTNDTIYAILAYFSFKHFSNKLAVLRDQKFSFLSAKDTNGNPKFTIQAPWKDTDAIRTEKFAFYKNYKCKKVMPDGFRQHIDNVFFKDKNNWGENMKYSWDTALYKTYAWGSDWLKKGSYDITKEVESSAADAAGSGAGTPPPAADAAASAADAAASAAGTTPPPAADAAASAAGTTPPPAATPAAASAAPPAATPATGTTPPPAATPAAAPATGSGSAAAGLGSGTPFQTNKISRIYTTHKYLNKQLEAIYNKIDSTTNISIQSEGKNLVEMLLGTNPYNGENSLLFDRIINYLNRT